MRISAGGARDFANRNNSIPGANEAVTNRSNRAGGKSNSIGWVRETAKNMSNIIGWARELTTRETVSEEKGNSPGGASDAVNNRNNSARGAREAVKTRATMLEVPGRLFRHNNQCWRGNGGW